IADLLIDALDGLGLAAQHFRGVLQNPHLWKIDRHDSYATLRSVPHPCARIVDPASPAAYLAIPAKGLGNATAGGARANSTPDTGGVWRPDRGYIGGVFWEEKIRRRRQRPIIGRRGNFRRRRCWRSFNWRWS